MNAEMPPIPLELQYIADLALKTRLKNEGAAYDFAEQATSAQLEELKSVADRMYSRKHHPMLMRWMDTYEITEWEISWWMYMLLVAMDAREFKFDSPNP